MKASDFFGVTSYVSFVEGQISKLEVDEMTIGDIGLKKLGEFRMCIGRYSKNTGKQFKTKMIDSQLHIGRMK